MISAVILVKNEEENIVDCLESVSFCDEILVIDDNSTDNTASLAKLHKAKVVKNSLGDNFSKQRNFALSIAKNDWVLFVDADERVSVTLAHEIKRSIEQNHADGYQILRRDKLFGKILKHGELKNKYFLRLGKKGSGLWKGSVHEKWDIAGNVLKLDHSLLHEPHKTIAEFLKEVNYYTTLRAKELHTQGIKSSFWNILFYTKGKFFITYFLKLGFLDGIPGLLLSLMMSFHSFLVRSKLYLLQTHE
ncbi:MAG: glycosyltransferase family 2 protein [Candidatus Levyibacteriota bacterium]